MSLPAQHQNERINTWLDNYAKAFNQADVSALIANYATPCVMSTPDKTLLVENAEQLASELHAIIAMM